MARKRDEVSADVQPALMDARKAARYLSVSTSTLRKLGVPRRILRSLPRYDRHDLDLFVASLPYEDEGDAEARKCDEAFD